MPKNPLFCRQVADKMKRAGRCVNTGPGSNQSDLVEGDRTMAVDSQYGDSRPKSNPEHDWQSLGSIAARLVEGAKK